MASTTDPVAHPRQVRELIFTSPQQLMSALRAVDITPLIGRLHPGAAERLTAGTLTVSELIVAALWMGATEPERMFGLTP